MNKLDEGVVTLAGIIEDAVGREGVRPPVGIAGVNQHRVQRVQLLDVDVVLRAEGRRPDAAELRPGERCEACQDDREKYG